MERIENLKKELEGFIKRVAVLLIGCYAQIFYEMYQ